MRTFGLIIARLVTFALVLGAGWVAFDTIKAKRSKGKTAPFGDTHYETVKQTIPENASDADTPQMQKERKDLAGR
jgi:hypothetical protein